MRSSAQRLLSSRMMATIPVTVPSGAVSRATVKAMDRACPSLCWAGTRSTSLPDVPTLAESGYKQVDVSTWYGIFAPAKTPREVVDKLAAEVNKQLATPAMIQAIHEQGAEPKLMSQKQFADLVQSDYKKWKTIVQESGATVE